MKKHTDLKRLDSMSDKRRKQQADGRSVAFADGGEGGEDAQETKQLGGSDFDLYILLKEMLTSNLAKENVEGERRQGKSRRQKNAFKDYSKLLTATLLPTHYVPAGGGWALADNGFDLHRSKVKCIGTNLADCDFGEPVSLDFQPLSTRVNLMCKLLIIIQGACLERAGPPKLVQDRCVQFDGDQESDAERQQARFRSNRVKSISCETLLSDTGKKALVYSLLLRAPCLTNNQAVKRSWHNTWTFFPFSLSRDMSQTYGNVSALSGSHKYLKNDSKR